MEMQFSALPRRRLSEKGQKICKNMAELHEAMFPEGEWIEQNYNETFTDPCIAMVDAPLEILPFFKIK